MDPVIVGIHDIRKGDTVKAMLVELIPGPREKESQEEEEAENDSER